MKSISNIETNKQQLEDYLSEFHPDMKVKILSENVFDFDCGPISFKDKMSKMISMPKIGRSAKNYWISRGWSKDEANKKRRIVKKDASTSPMNREFWKMRGLNDQQIDFQIKSQRKMNKEYWVRKGYSDDQAILKVEEFQKESSAEYIKKLKSDEDYKLSVCRKRKNNINYWLDRGYSLSDSKKNQSDSQTTFTLSKCIEKYGLELGTQRWQERQEKWSSSLLKNGNLKIGYSKVSQDLFDDICNNLHNTNYIFYGKKNKELSIVNGNKSKGFLYDFTDLFGKKIIEFNGDIYHGNPCMFEKLDKPNPFKDMRCEEIWERDRIKIDLAKENGFEVLVIWESEYRSDKVGTLNKCLDFIKNKN